MRDVAIKRGQVYGMRCSGTNYLDALISRNMVGLTLGAARPRMRRNFGWKHGDVGAKTYLHYKGHLHDVEIMPLDWASSRDTLLFVIYRNPISWLRSLHNNPHQSPGSYGLTFDTFIRQPWRAFHCDPPGSESHPDKRIRMKNVRSKNIIESYDSVFTMRRTKIMIFESFLYRFQNVVYVNLETLEQGPEQYLREIADCYHLRMTDKFEDVTTYKGGDAPYQKTRYEPLSNDDLQHILTKLDWANEIKAGYGMRAGGKLLARQTRIQIDPENLINILPHKKYYKYGSPIMPSTSYR